MDNQDNRISLKVKRVNYKEYNSDEFLNKILKAQKDIATLNEIVKELINARYTSPLVSAIMDKYQIKIYFKRDSQNQPIPVGAFPQLVAEANGALSEIILKYNPSKKFRFNTFAYSKIRYAVLNSFKKYYPGLSTYKCRIINNIKKITKNNSMMENMDYKQIYSKLKMKPKPTLETVIECCNYIFEHNKPNNNTFTKEEFFDTDEFLNNKKYRLSDNEKTVFKMRKDGYTLKEIAQELHVSVSRVSQINKFIKRCYTDFCESGKIG